jgi:hypothetical protein
MAPFAAVFAEIDARLPWLDVERWRPDPSRARSFVFDAHWALYVENYLEGLHIPFLHPRLTQTLDLDGYTYELGRWCNLQLARARTDEPAFEPPPGSPENGQRIAAYYWWVFPNLMLNFYPWGLSLNQVLPLGPARTRVVFCSYVADPSLLGGGAGGAPDAVELEDEAAVLSVQRGIRSRFYAGGRTAGARARRASVSLVLRERSIKRRTYEGDCCRWANTVRCAPRSPRLGTNPSRGGFARDPVRYLGRTARAKGKARFEDPLPTDHDSPRTPRGPRPEEASMNDAVADRGGTRPADDDPVAVIVVHGVADQPRGGTAEAVATQLALETSAPRSCDAT